MKWAHAQAHVEQNVRVGTAREVPASGWRSKSSREQTKNGGCILCAASAGSALGIPPWRRPADSTGPQGSGAAKNGACGCGGRCGACAKANTADGMTLKAPTLSAVPDNKNGEHENASNGVAVAHGAAAAGAAAVACPAAQKASKATACIQPVVIAKDDGSEPTTAPSFDKVQSIWKKCCIDYSIKAPQTVKKSAYRTLDESLDTTPTAEESALFAAAGSSSCIQVFVPVEFAQDGKTGKNISGGGGTYDGGAAHPKIVIVEGAAPEVVAHEVGHASGYSGHDAVDTVMKPTGAYNVANSTDVSLDVCTEARTGAVLKSAGTADCCQRVK